MSASLMALLVVGMVATSFLSGIFGMAGGLVLMGVLLGLLPLPEAMALHAVTQIASNGWRGLLWWRHVRWRPALTFLAGCGLAVVAFSFWRYVPAKGVALVLLGVAPFVVQAAPVRLKPNPERFTHGAVYGATAMTLMLLAGVSGPLIDAYFLGGSLQRRQIVATKAVCQICGHAAKFVYFGGLVEEAARLDPLLASLAVLASMLGTSLARPMLERLTDTQYRIWARRIITTIAVCYLVHGSTLLVWS